MAADRGTKTHRCPDCPQEVEHYQDELDKVDGRCREHTTTRPRSTDA